MVESADGKTLFVNTQQPGESTPANSAATTDGWIADAAKLESQRPTKCLGLSAAYGPGTRPRSATIVITRNDGGKVGV